MPGSRDEPLEWTIRAYKEGVLVREITEPMWHDPIFGPDVDDVRTLEEATDKLLAELGEGVPHNGSDAS